MSLGYDKALYLLPFDHRGSYVTGMFHLELPLTMAEHDQVASSKRLIYDGFRQALDSNVPATAAGILVDEEFGADILRDATARDIITAMSVEKSGSTEFQFEYGDDFAAHLEAFGPTFAKVLVRYNPEGDAALNQRQIVRLKRLSDYCRAAGQRFMFELLVPATKMQMQQIDADQNAYDGQLRPALMREAIRTLQDAGVEPDIWKIEGLDHRTDCEQLVEVVQRDGRGAIGCIVLGRGADEKKVEHWLKIAAAVPGFIGFAVGRTTFWRAVAAFESKEMTREEAVSNIADRYCHWVSIFEKSRDRRVASMHDSVNKIANGLEP